MDLQRLERPRLRRMRGRIPDTRPGTEYDGQMVIAVDSAGNSYHAGTFHGTLTLGNQTFSQTSVSGYPWDGTGISDAYVGKLLSNGTWDWVSIIGSYAPLTIVEDIAVDDSGRVTIIGECRGVLYSNKTSSYSGDFNQCGGASYHGTTFVARFEENGSFEWMRHIYTTDGDNRAGGVDADQEGNAYITGGVCYSVGGASSCDVAYFRDAEDSNSITLTLQTGASAGTSNFHEKTYVAKLDQHGEWEWAKAAGTGQWVVSSGREVVLGTDDSLYISGTFDYLWSSRPMSFGGYWGNLQVESNNSQYSGSYIAKLDTEWGSSSGLGVGQRMRLGRIELR